MDVGVIHMLVFEEQHFPIVVVRWSGELTMTDATLFFERAAALRERATRVGTRLAMINVSDVDKASPEVRRVLAQRGKEFADEAVLSWVVLGNVIVRGIFTAIQWMEPSTKRNRVVATYEQALREAKEALKASSPSATAPLA